MANRADLIALLEDCAERARHRDLTLGEVVAELKDSAFCFATILLTLPLLLPFPLGPLAIFGGMAIAVLGWQMLRGASHPRLPERVYKAQLSARAWGNLLGVCRRVLALAERFSRTRLLAWVSGVRGERIAGLFILCSGLLLAIPMGGLPFNNTLPALVALSACIALLERDGVWFVIAAVWLVLTLVYFSLIAYLLIYFGVEFKAWLTTHMPSWM